MTHSKKPKKKVPKLTRLQYLRLRRIIQAAVRAGYNCGDAGSLLCRDKKTARLRPCWMIVFDQAVEVMEHK